MPANNGAVATPLYQPAMRVITNITNATVPTVTTSFAHNYTSTDIIRIVIPSGFGMSQINGLVSPIVVTGPTTFTISINTLNFDAFSDPNNGQFAQSIAMGENSSTIYGATMNTAPSYIRYFVP
jgi:hypothetical protein